MKQGHKRSLKVRNIVGQLFFIVGNSGSGKDSLIREVKNLWPQEFPPLKIARRYITRPPHETEPYYSVSKPEFQKMQSQGKFCLSWFIYDTFYGVSADILDCVKNGNFCIVNVSRKIVSSAKVRFPELKVIFVRVPFEITLERIRSRGREAENSPEYQARIKRAQKNQNFPDADTIIDNSGDLMSASKDMYDYIQGFVEK